jgi:quinol-cytochrome oxidoreductase complex cytochrome b subunit
MRFIKTLLTSAGMLFATVGTATAMVLQEPALQVEVETSPSRTVWYADPVWLAIGGIVVLIIIVLAVMAARGKGNDTTVVR